MGFIYVIYIYLYQIFSRMVGKVCVIGGGPSGLGVLCWFAKLKREGKVGNGKFLEVFFLQTEKREGEV